MMAINDSQLSRSCLIIKFSDLKYLTKLDWIENYEGSSD